VKIGGATSQIGDPTGRTTSREALKDGTREDNEYIINLQIERIFHNVGKIATKHNTGAPSSVTLDGTITNNKGYYPTLSFLEVLKTLGTGFRLGSMLSRDTCVTLSSCPMFLAKLTFCRVKLKMEKGDGMSFAEFSYPLLQAYDWWYLHQLEDVQIQIGGSDQFGNIVTGIDAIRHMTKISNDKTIRTRTAQEAALYEPFGLTVPLLTTASGAKFGKSAGNAIWLEKSMTGVFDLYGVSA